MFKTQQLCFKHNWETCLSQYCVIHHQKMRVTVLFRALTWTLCVSLFAGWFMSAVIKLKCGYCKDDCILNGRALHTCATKNCGGVSCIRCHYWRQNIVTDSSGKPWPPVKSGLKLQHVFCFTCVNTQGAKCHDPDRAAKYAACQNGKLWIPKAPKQQQPVSFHVCFFWDPPASFVGSPCAARFSLSPFLIMIRQGKDSINIVSGRVMWIWLRYGASQANPANPANPAIILCQLPRNSEVDFVCIPIFIFIFIFVCIFN